MEEISCAIPFIQRLRTSKINHGVRIIAPLGRWERIANEMRTGAGPGVRLDSVSCPDW